MLTSLSQLAKAHSPIFITRFNIVISSRLIHSEKFIISYYFYTIGHFNEFNIFASLKRITADFHYKKFSIFFRNNNICIYAIYDSYNRIGFFIFIEFVFKILSVFFIYDFLLVNYPLIL